MAVQPTSAPARIASDPGTVAEAYWTGGARNELLIAHCAACQRLLHPPGDTCPQCGGALVPRRVSGAGVVISHTVNYQQFHPDVTPPYVIALVELVEQAGLRLAANIVDCEPEAVHSGMAVQVRFEHRGQRYVPVFAP